jgi:hypothetical protein
MLKLRLSCDKCLHDNFIEDSLAGKDNALMESTEVIQGNSNTANTNSSIDRRVSTAYR